MKVEPYVRKLSNSNSYKEFASKNKDAYIVAGFFVMDFESGNALHQIDYYLPKEHKVAAFTLGHEVIMQEMKLINDKPPERLEIDAKIDLDAIQGIIDDEMKNRGFSEDIKKIIAILQTIKGKKRWDINCVLSGMSILKAHVDDDTKTVLKMEKSSIMDYLQRTPKSQLPAQMQGQQAQQVPQQGQPQVQQEEGEVIIPSGKPSKEQIKAQLDKLQKMEGAIEIEKEKLSNALKNSKVDKKKKK